VLLAHQVAIESDLVTADMVEVTEFPHLALKYSVRAVPRIAIGEDIFIDGAVPEEMLLGHFRQIVERDGG
jgi:predicted DsbA family dithiol-disulfide isomerase